MKRLSLDRTMVLPLTLVRKLIRALVIAWIVIGVLDGISQTLRWIFLFDSVPKYQYFMFAMPIYLFVALPSIFAYKSFTVVEQMMMIVTRLQYLKLECSRQVFLETALISVTASLSFAFSPALSLPAAIVAFARRARVRMENIPEYACVELAHTRDVNRMFAEFLSLTPNTELIWHNHVFLRCLFATMHNLQNVTEDHEAVDLYLRALEELMQIYTSDGLDDIWGKYFCEPHLENQKVFVPFSGYNSYARGYVYLLLCIFSIEVGVFWICRTCIVGVELPRMVLIAGITRDALHLLLLVLIVWLYFEHIKSEVKYRYRWRFGVGNTRVCWHLMHGTIWLVMMQRLLDEYLSQVIGGNTDLAWMTPFILEYCTEASNDMKRMRVWIKNCRDQEAYTRSDLVALLNA